jgi:hypothetical protein
LIWALVGVLKNLEFDRSQVLQYQAAHESRRKALDAFLDKMDQEGVAQLLGVNVETIQAWMRRTTNALPYAAQGYEFNGRACVQWLCNQKMAEGALEGAKPGQETIQRLAAIFVELHEALGLACPAKSTVAKPAAVTQSSVIQMRP